MSRDTALRHAPWISVACLALAVYANSLANGFAYDDVWIIQNNSRVHQLADQSLIWLKPYWPGYGAQLGLYRPFAIFMYAIEWAIGDGSPLVFHSFNVALHALASVLAFFLLRTLVGTTLPALMGAFVFAVHPVRTEVVANVVGQAELIAAAAMLGACLLYAARPAGAGTGWKRRIGIVALFLIAVLTKESAIVLPGLLVALDLAQRRVALTRMSLRRYLAHATFPLFLVVAAACAYLILRVSVLGSVGGVDAAPNLPFLREQHRLPTALRAWPEYVRLLFFPADLASDYAPAVILPVEVLSPMALLGAVLLLGTVMLALLTPQVPAAGLPAAWFLISVLPVSNLLMPIGVVLAERLLYTPTFAVSLIVAYGLHALGPGRLADYHRGVVLPYAALSIALALMAGRTVVRNPDWKDMEAVGVAIVRDHPESYRAHWIESSRLFQRGQPGLAMQHLEFANRLWPNDSQLLTDLAYQIIGRGEFDKAIELLERSRAYVDWVAVTEVLLAGAAIGAQDHDRALQAAIRADRLGAAPYIIFPMYAQVYEGLGRLPDAIGAWQATLRAPQGRTWQYWSKLARALAQYGAEHSALLATDSAGAMIPPADTASLAIVATLRDEIGRGCYAPAPTPMATSVCADPIGEWQVLFSNVFFANNSQNASAGTSPGAESASALRP